MDSNEYTANDAGTRLGMTQEEFEDRYRSACDDLLNAAQREEFTVYGAKADFRPIEPIPPLYFHSEIEFHARRSAIFPKHRPHVDLDSWYSVNLSRDDVMRLRPDSNSPPKELARDEPEVDPYRTGLAGRPGAAHWTDAEFERRISSGEALPSITAESRELIKVARQAPPERPAPAAKKSRKPHPAPLLRSWPSSQARQEERIKPRI